MKHGRGLSKTIVAIIVSLALMIPFIPTAFAGPSDPVTMDATLFTALSNIGIHPDSSHPTHFTEGELSNLTGTLNLSNQSITGINGLEYCTGISELYLDGNPGITSITKLDENVMDLQVLSLRNTGVTSFPGDLDMHYLRTLDLSGTPITDNGPGGNQPIRPRL